MSTIDALANALLAKIRQSPRKSLDSAAGAYTSSRRDVVVIDEYALDKSAARWAAQPVGFDDRDTDAYIDFTYVGKRGGGR